MTNKLIYLDNNATTKVDERVLEAMLPYFKEEYANPSSMYDFAKKPAAAIREARGKIKDFVNAKDEKEIECMIENSQINDVVMERIRDFIKED